ncbi:MAG TPA: hypothetical protein VK400_01925 [Pyrinomonadaceae bacterium]|nr:hypothetical protein [Pyrinomonadaceae bacterium]
MKTLSEKQALVKLGRLKAGFQSLIRENYEHRAKDCRTCPVQGACCTDAHFVNVHITRLEAVAVRQILRTFDEAKQKEIYRRAAETIEKYDLKASGDTFAQTFACPLFEKGVGCLIHKEGKPAPCIQHACYENKADLPPDELLEEMENRIERLNRQTYRQNPGWLPLPLWLSLTKP